MRRTTLVFLCFAMLALPAAAQEYMAARTNRPNFVNYERLVQALTAAVKRDAFIVGQLAAGAGELQDFQKLTAIEKVNDRIEAALKRAAENPTASAATLNALNGLAMTFRHAREQGTMADTESLRKELMDRTHFIQRDLFRELDAARNERQTLVEIETKVAAMNADLESAMIEALGATLDFIRAGGK